MNHDSMIIDATVGTVPLGICGRRKPDQSAHHSGFAVHLNMF